MKAPGVQPMGARWKSVLFLIAVGPIVFISIFAVLAVLALLLNGRSVANRDFIEYWAAGQQLLHGQNPYDSKAILEIERSAGYATYAPAAIMANPPSALVLVSPLGLVGAKAGSALWSLLLVAFLAISVRLLSIMYGSDGRPLYLVAGFCFAPALTCLAIGQIGVLCLLGFVLFLYFNRARPLLAGMSLWLCALKPHLFLPFLAVLLAWSLWRRKYSVLLGGMLALATSSAISLWIEPSLWAQYAQMMQAARVDQEFMPIPSVLLRLWVKPHASWLQAAPAVAGCIWSLGYFRVHREDWDWRTHAPLLLLVSLLVAPYSFYTDQAVLLAAIFHRLYTAGRGSLLILAAINTAMLAQMLAGVPMRSELWLWTSAAWILWYLFSDRQVGTADPVLSTA